MLARSPSQKIPAGMDVVSQIIDSLSENWWLMGGEFMTGQVDQGWAWILIQMATLSWILFSPRKKVKHVSHTATTSPVCQQWTSLFSAFGTNCKHGFCFLNAKKTLHLWQSAHFKGISWKNLRLELSGNNCIETTLVGLQPFHPVTTTTTHNYNHTPPPITNHTPPLPNHTPPLPNHTPHHYPTTHHHYPTTHPTTTQPHTTTNNQSHTTTTPAAQSDAAQLASS